MGQCVIRLEFLISKLISKMNCLCTGITVFGMQNQRHLKLSIGKACGMQAKHYEYLALLRQPALPANQRSVVSVPRPWLTKWSFQLYKILSTNKSCIYDSHKLFAMLTKLPLCSGRMTRSHNAGVVRSSPACLPITALQVKEATGNHFIKVHFPGNNLVSFQGFYFNRNRVCYALFQKTRATAVYATTRGLLKQQKCKHHT